MMYLYGFPQLKLAELIDNEAFFILNDVFLRHNDVILRFMMQLYVIGCISTFLYKFQ